MKCGTVNCDNEADVETFWPGNSTKQCMSCAKRSMRAAVAMGFELEIRPLVKEPMQ